MLTRFLKTLIALLLTLSIFSLNQSVFAAAKLVNWTVNSWGSSSHVYQYSDSSCGTRDGKTSTSFLVKTRGSGDAELVLANALDINQAYALNVWMKSDKPTQVSVFFRRDGFPYETTAIQTINLNGWQLVKLEGVHASNGRGSVRIAVKNDNVKLCVSASTLENLDFSSIGIANANVSLKNNDESNEGDLVKDTFFGVHVNKLGQHSKWPAFDPGTLRLWDTGTTWANLQPVKGPVQWTYNDSAKRLDYYVSYGTKNHSNLQFIYTLGMTPIWAGTFHPKNCNRSSYGFSTCTKPTNLDDWRSYVRELGLRYKGVIKVWEVWNEADYWAHWDNSPEDIVPLVQIAYQELKGIDPENKIIGPNVTGSGLRFLSKFLAAGGGHYIDGVSVHAYIGRSPELSLATLRNVKQMLIDQNLGDLPIWNTETNVSCNSAVEDCKPIESNTNVLSAEDSLSQALVGNAALKVANFTFYTWEGASQSYGGVPLVEANYIKPTKAGKVIEIIKRWLVGAQVDYVKADFGGLNEVQVQKSGETALILWTAKAEMNIDLKAWPALTKYSYADEGVVREITNKQLLITTRPILVYPSTFKF